jgi:hypothetical protein
VLLQTESMRFRRVRRTNSTETSFASRVPTATEPKSAASATATSQEVTDLLTQGSANGGVQTRGLFVFFGAGTEDTTFSARVIGWRVIGSDPEADLWVPVVLAEFACTLSATVGVAGTPCVATDRFVDTITLVTGNDDVSVDFVSPTADEIAHAVVDLKGFAKVEVSFDLTGATDANALVALY